MLTDVLAASPPFRRFVGGTETCRIVICRKPNSLVLCLRSDRTGECWSSRFYGPDQMKAACKGFVELVESYVEYMGDDLLVGPDLSSEEVQS